MKEGGYPKDVRAGEQFKGLNKKGTRFSENAKPKETPVSSGAHAKSVQHALEEGIAAGKGHPGKRGSNSGARPGGVKAGPSDHNWNGEYKNSHGTPEGMGLKPGKHGYGYEGHYSRGEHHEWKGNEAPSHPEAHEAIEGGHKHDHKTQMPAGVPHAHVMSDGRVVGSHGFGHTGGQVKGVLRVSGHHHGHQLGQGKGRGGRGIFGKK